MKFLAVALAAATLAAAVPVVPAVDNVDIDKATDVVGDVKNVLPGAPVKRAAQGDELLDTVGETVDNAGNTISDAADGTIMDVDGTIHEADGNLHGLEDPLVNVGQSVQDTVSGVASDDDQV